MSNKYTTKLFIALAESEKVYNVFSLSELGCIVKFYDSCKDRDSLVIVSFQMGNYGITHNNKTTWVKPDDLKDYFLSI